MDWDKLKTFHAAAETGSLTAAASALKLSQSAASRQIAQLERDLGVALFHRHPRGLTPTEQGALLFNATTDMAKRAALAETLVRDSKDLASGPMHVSAPFALGSVLLAPRLGRFLSACPDIQLHLDLTDDERELSAGEAQAAVQLWRPQQQDVVQRRLLLVSQSIFASPDYIERHGAPQSVAELKDHPIIVCKGGPPVFQQRMSWLLRLGEGGPVSAALTVNAVLGVMKAIEAGVGIGALPRYLARSSPNLVEILTDVRGPEFDVYFVYPEELRGSQRIAAFGDFLTECAHEWAAEASGAAADPPPPVKTKAAPAASPKAPSAPKAAPPAAPPAAPKRSRKGAARRS